jgi:hypothetical protein
MVINHTVKYWGMAKAISTKTTVFVCMGVLLTIGTMLVATPTAYADKICGVTCKGDVDASQDNDVTTTTTTTSTTKSCTAPGGTGGSVTGGGPPGSGGNTGGAGGAGGCTIN